MNEFRLITLDPGHFHAALVQKEMYPDVGKRVHVYAPVGTDVTAHINRIAGFNSRKDSPTSWEVDIHCAPDFLARMLADRPGNVVVLAGRNHVKIDYIRAAVEAGFHVLSDKPWIITPDGLPQVESALEAADRAGLIAFDIMTERFEVTSILQKALVGDPEVFGSAEKGTPDSPAVEMESVHHLMKVVAGTPLLRPAWFFDIHQQGEGLSDVGPHLVDLVQWTLFPEQAIDYRQDIELVNAARWPTVLSENDLQRVTGQAGLPALDYFCNNSVTYRLRGIHVTLKAVWNYEAPPGAGDTHFAVYRGTRSSIEVRQGPEEQYRTELYVVPAASVRQDVENALRSRVSALEKRFAGIAVTGMGDRLRVDIPDVHRVGHEAHFAQVARQFFEYVRNPMSLPAWEKPNMLAKYFVTTTGVELSRSR